MTKIEQEPYKAFLSDIKEKIHQARYQAMKQVNKTLLALYWELGEGIANKQKQHGWGKSIVETLSKDLQNEFPGEQGYSVQNLWYMRQMYMEYQGNTKLQPLVGEIGWSHNLVIMSKCKDNLEREFYLRMTKKYGWSKNVLIHQVEGKSYENFLLGQTNFDKAVPEKYRHQAILAVKDEYTGCPCLARLPVAAGCGLRGCHGFCTQTLGRRARQKHMPAPCCVSPMRKAHRTRSSSLGRWRTFSRLHPCSTRRQARKYPPHRRFDKLSTSKGVFHPFNPGCSSRQIKPL